MSRSIVAVFLLFFAHAKVNGISEFIFTSSPFPSAHASTIVELPDGDLLTARFGGTDGG